MNVEQREKLLDLHRAAMRAETNYNQGIGSLQEAEATDDAFRQFLFSLEVTE